MAPKIEVDHKLYNDSPIDFSREIREALEVVPIDDLRGLIKIVVVYGELPHNSRAMGSYFSRREGHAQPLIMMSGSKIKSCAPKGIPLISKFMIRMYLRDTLYHEIAHHVQRLKHGLSKNKWETHAAKYSRELQRRKYRQTFAGRCAVWLCIHIFSLQNRSRQRIRKN